MSQQNSSESEAQPDNPGPQKIDMAAAAGKSPQAALPEAPPAAAATPQQPPLPHITLKDAQAPDKPAVAPPPVVKAAEAAPAALPEAKAKPRAKPSAPKSTAMDAELQELKREQAELRTSIDAARSMRRLQTLRQAGVEVLSDKELLKLSPKCDPDSPEGKRELSDWISEHQDIVSPKYRTRPSPAPSIIEKTKEQKGLMAVFGDESTLISKVNAYFKGGQ